MKKAARPKAAKSTRLPKAPGGLPDLAHAALRAEPLTAEAERARQRQARNAEADLRLAAALRKGVSALHDKKAEKVVVLRLEGVTTMADFFVIASAANDKQARAMADAVELALKAEGQRPLSVEGYQRAAWILLDFGDVVYHVFDEESRRFFGLERLWGDAADATAEFAG